MAGGYGAASFGGEFGKSLAAILLHDRTQKHQDEQDAIKRQFQGDLSLLGPAIELGIKTGNWSGAQGVVERVSPDLAKRFKKEGSPFDILGPLLNNPALSGQPVGTPPIGTTSPDLEQEPKAPLVPTRVAQAPPAPRQRFLGMDMPTPEEQAIQDATTKGKVSEAIMQRVRDVVYPTLKQIDPGSTIEDAFAVMGIHLPSTYGATGIRYGGTVGGADLPDGTVDSFGRPTEKDAFYRVENMPDGTKRFVPTTTPGLVSAGAELERAAVLMGYRRLADVPPDQRPAVEAKAKELSAALAKGTSQARVEGTGTGKMNVPADLSTAQTTGVPVGTTANEVAGQAVPTQAVNERRRSVETLRASLQEMIDDPTYLEALPKKGELGELLPGAAYALRRRNPEYREKIAKLEAKVNNIVNVMARAVGEQRGTQTEQDALRAESAIAQIRDSLTTGDTQESARVRITESLKTLDQLLKKLPAPPVPKKGEPAPANGVTTKDGKLYINGKLIPGQ